jgi:Tfp pilus assembly protein PilF
MPRGQSSDVIAVGRPWPAAGTALARAPRALATAVPLLLAAITFGVFSAALDNQFVDWDDSVLLTKNESFRGLGWAQLRWMTTTITMGHYVPVTWLSLGLDYVLWGMDPAGYHFTNLVLHAANAAVFYLVALRLLRAATSSGGSALVIAAAVSSLFFALHPLRAESVAWVTERRDVLSGLFLFVTILFYLRARDVEGASRIRRHAVACVCYLLAILSKSMVMTLPALLVLLDVYPFRRLGSSPRSWANPDVWREKVPYLALGILAAMLGYWAQAANRFITSFEAVPWSARPVMVLHSLWFYAAKTILPLNLSPLYELPTTISILEPRFLVPAIAVTVVATGLTALARRWPAGITVAIAYAVTIAPVAGIVHSGYQLTHDRYSYLACLGFALLVGGGVGAVYDASARGTIRRALGYGAVFALAAWIAALAFLTWNQVAVWRDTETLWRHAVDSSPECSVCELNLGVALMNRDRLEAALEHLERAHAERPDRVRIRQNVGLALARLGRIEQSVDHFRSVIAKYPDDVPVLTNLGVSLMKLGRYDEGVRHLRRAAVLAPDDAFVLFNYGTALEDIGSTDEAIATLRRAVTVDPAAVHARGALVRALAARGDVEGARRDLGFLRVHGRGLADFLGPLTLETW